VAAAREAILATLTLTGADDGRAVDVHLGDEVVVSLPENPTTGFRWEVAALRGVQLVGEASFRLAEPVALGSGGNRTFRFTASDVGLGRIELIHRRSWEGDATALGRFAVDVAIRA
jgi:inhibitor of cysteine peptidase